MLTKYDCLYSPDELVEIARRARLFDGHARRVAVTFNNNRDYPTQDALDVKRLLGLEAPAPEPVKAASRRESRRPRARSLATGELFVPEPDQPDHDRSGGSRAR